MFNTPILFLIFNRPDTAQQVFSKIKAIQPRQLFIAADGPRNAEEAEKCEQTRKLVLDAIDWDCDVKTLFREKNLGCGEAPSQAISWFFEHVEQGIILEDDCLPNTSFFHFCEEMLHRYSSVERVMMIGGSSWLNSEDKIKYEYDYFFTHICSVWGWASWRRAWKNNKYIITNDMLEKADKDLIWSSIYNKKLNKFKKQLLFNTYMKKVETWDIQWDYCISANKGISILPIYNLISNIGINGSNYSQESPLLNLPTTIIDIDKLKHPKDINVPYKMDLYYQNLEAKKFFQLNESYLRYSINKTKFYILKFLKSISL